MEGCKMKTLTFNLKDLSAPRDICHILEKEGTKYYVYSFQSKDDIIKFGKAADNEWMFGTWGNRLYRQAGGIAGWGVFSLNDTSAKDMRMQMQKHFPDLTRNDITVTVYDFTEELDNKKPSEIDKRLLNEENDRVKQYTLAVGRRPNLNIQPTKNHFSPVWPDIFEEV
jgi:hypothetical protein